LYFNQTPAATKFLELMAEIERTHEGAATDDFFLQEAWARHEQQMSVLVLPPDIVGRDWPLKSHQSMYVGISGNVSTFKGQVQQHVAFAATPAARKAALMAEAAVALGGADLAVAELLYSRALALSDRDDDLANKIARIMRRDGRLPAALAFLHRYQGEDSPVDLERRFSIESDLSAGRLVEARAACAALSKSPAPADRRWAEGASLRVALDSRARATGIADRDRPAVAWEQSVYRGYVADLTALYVVDRLSGIPPMLVAPGEGMQVGGSSVRAAHGAQAVWGGGISSMEDMLNPHVKYCAVRGPLTRHHILEYGGSCPSVFGDPVWFLPHLYRPARPGKGGGAQGLVLHPDDQGLVAVEAGVRLLPATCADYAGLESFISALHGLSAVLTTSLTTLMVCHAYGIPARWLHVQGRAGDGPVHDDAVRDYLLSVGSEAQTALQAIAGSRMNSSLFAVDDTWLPARSIELEPLAAAAPFKIAADRIR
jgi:hypothetical protein